MLKIGITGGIGSGKTTCCLLFEQRYHVPVYYADVRAKHIIRDNREIKQQIIALLGKEAYINNNYNTKYVAQQVFEDKHKLSQLNQIIHPAVYIDAMSFFKQHQDQKYVLYEAAILFESGNYQLMDSIILVTAPTVLKIDRVMQRDVITHQEVKQRMRHQLSDSEKLFRSNYIIINDYKHSLASQVDNIHKDILSSNSKR